MSVNEITKLAASVLAFQ